MPQKNILTSPKAAPKKIAAAKVVKKSVAKPAAPVQVSEEVQALRDAFVAYDPDLRVLPPKTDTKSWSTYFTWVLPGTKLQRRVNADPAWIDSGKAPWPSVQNMLIDVKTLKKPAVKETMKAMPFWWQVEQGFHPVLPKVPDLAKFLSDWIDDLNQGAEGVTSIYTGQAAWASKIFRFCEQEKKTVPVPALVEKYIPALNCGTQYYDKARFLNVYSSLTGGSGGAIKDPLKVPVVTPGKAAQLVEQAHYTSTSFVTEAPTILEFEDNSEMLAKVMEHCKQIPGFEVHYLRKMMVAYTSDGHMSAHPTAFNKGNGKALLYNPGAADPQKVLIAGTEVDNPGYVKLKAASVPIIYVGECWAINFSFFDKVHACSSNMVYFAEWEKFVETYNEYRPDELAGVPEFTDLVFICSHWCERDSARNYSKGIELQTPVTRQLSLRNWIVGPFLEHTLRNTKIKGVNSYSGAMTMKKIQVAEDMIKKQGSSSVKPKIAPLWAEHMKSLAGDKK